MKERVQKHIISAVLVIFALLAFFAAKVDVEVDVERSRQTVPSEQLSPPTSPENSDKTRHKERMLPIRKNKRLMDHNYG